MAWFLQFLVYQKKVNQVPRLPEKGKNWLKFQNDYKAIRKLFSVYNLQRL